MNTCSIIPVTVTGSARVHYAIVGRGVHRTTVARRFGTVEDARDHASRHQYTVTSVYTADTL